jgi:hypothetical protein
MIILFRVVIAINPQVQEMIRSQVIEVDLAAFNTEPRLLEDYSQVLCDQGFNPVASILLTFLPE